MNEIPAVAAATPRPSPRWRVAMKLAAAAMLARAALLALFAGIKRESWLEFLAHSDAASFLRMGRVLAQGAPAQALSFYDHRAFPGWPVFMAAATELAPEPLAVLGLTLLLGAVVPVAVYFLSGCERLSLAVALLPPVWLLSSAYPMAEPLLLAAGAGALVAASSGAWLWAGFLGGLACVTKPYAVFLALGLAWAAWRGPSATPAPLRLGKVFLGSLLPVVAAASLCVLRFGVVAPQLAVYSAPLDQLNIPAEAAQRLGAAVGHWDWPGKALVLTPLRLSVPAWKIGYIFLHVVAAVALTVRGARRGWTSGIPWQQGAAIWLLGNTAASFCAGPYWGFHSFDRYVSWAWPAAALLNRDLFVSRRWLALAGALSFSAAAFALLR